MSRHAEDPDTAAYRRVSTQQQATDWKSSLRDQTAAIRREAGRLGRTLLDEHFFEDVFSGEIAEERPGFMALVAFCQAHPRPRSAPGIVLVLNDSRFGRFEDPDEAASWRFELARHGWLARFVENDNTESVTTRHLMRAAGSAQASEYLAQLKANVRRGKRGAAGQGFWQGMAPVGYRRAIVTTGGAPVVLDTGQRRPRGQRVRLTPGPKEEVEAVRWAFEAYAGGVATLAKLRAELRRRVTRLSWSGSYVNHMLRNRAYLGELVCGRKTADKRERRERPLRPESEWVVTRDAHPPLVSPETFEAVQARLAKNRRPERPPRGQYVLAKLIHCASCGMPFISGGGRRSDDPADPGRYRFYIDSGAVTGVCAGPAATLERRLLEDSVVREVARAVSDPRVQAAIRAEVDRRLAELARAPAHAEAELAKEKKRLAGRRDQAVRLIAAGELDHEQAALVMEEIRAGEERVEESQRALAASRTTAEELERERERLVALTADFPARARELSGPQLRELLVPWIKDAVFDKHSRTLTLRIRRVPGGGGRTRPFTRRIRFPRPAQDPRTGRWVSSRERNPRGGSRAGNHVEKKGG